jgi:LL-diaminopimelate aminotransferase
LQVSKEGVVSFFSLSKRSNMTGYRVGWVAGDGRIISLMLQIKTSADSGTPWFIQQAAIEALRDEESVDKMRNEYRLIRDMLVDTLTSVGLEECRPEGALYIWQKIPDGMSAREFASRLLRPEIAVICIPGDMLASSLDDGSNPGQGYVRFSLTCLPERVKEACKRIKENKAEIFK